MLEIYASSNVKLKLSRKHRVTMDEVEQAFCNIEYGFLEDTREDHKTDPPTYWFVAETFKARILKVIFIRERDGKIWIKSAYDATPEIQNIYKKVAKN